MFLINKKYKIICKNIIILQSFVRIIIAKKKLLLNKHLKASINIQKYYRRYKSILEFNRRKKIYNLTLNNNAKVIQSIIRSYLHKKKLIINSNNYMATIIQKNYRMKIYFNNYKNTLKSIIKIQKKIKSFLHNKNNILNKNKELKITLIKKDKIIDDNNNRISNLEKKYNEMKEIIEKINSQNINVTESKNKKILNLNSDIKLFRNYVSESVEKKVSLLSEIDKLRIENMKMKKLLTKKEKRGGFWNFFGK